MHQALAIIPQHQALAIITNNVLNIDVSVAFEEQHSCCFYMPTTTSIAQRCQSILIDTTTNIQKTAQTITVSSSRCIVYVTHTNKQRYESFDEFKSFLLPGFSPYTNFEWFVVIIYYIILVVDIDAKSTRFIIVSPTAELVILTNRFWSSWMMVVRGIFIIFY